MIKTKVEKCGGGVIQELDAKGTARTLLIELKALNIGGAEQSDAYSERRGNADG